MLGDEVATYLAGAGLGLTMTTSGTAGPVFAVPFPAEAPDTATCIIEYGAMPSLDAFGPSLNAPVFERPRFQVVCRDKQDNILACRTLSQSIQKKLRHFSGTMGNSVAYGFIQALQPPFFLRYDDNMRPHYVANYQATKVEST